MNKTESTRRIDPQGTGKKEANAIERKHRLASNRIGAAKGKFTIPGDFDADNREIADLFMESTKDE